VYRVKRPNQQVKSHYGEELKSLSSQPVLMTKPELPRDKMQKKYTN